MGLVPFDIRLEASRDTVPAARRSVIDATIFGINGPVKRAMDLLLTCPALLFLMPMLAFVAIAIKLEGGPLFYTQTRIGKDGNPFQMLKFRTMRVDADGALQELLARCPESAAEWSKYQKLRNDPRVTRIGKFLRASSIDELPQLWNIVRGDMSLVGQRPLLYTQRDAYGVHIDGYERARPGLTGLWQVRGRNALSFEERARLGSEYMNRWSLWFDIKIIALTVPAVLWSKDAY